MVGLGGRRKGGRWGRRNIAPGRRGQLSRASVDLDVSRSGSQLEVRSALSYLTVQLAAPDGALHGDRVLGRDVTGAVVCVEAEGGAGGQAHGDVARAGLEVPFAAARIALGGDAAAAGSHPQRAAQAAQLDRPRAGFHFAVAGAGLL